MDLASTIPFEALAYLFTGKYDIGLPYSLLGLLRFWRLRRVKQFFTRFVFGFCCLIGHLSQKHDTQCTSRLEEYIELEHCQIRNWNISLKLFLSLRNGGNFPIDKTNYLFCRLEKDIRFSYFWVRCARLLSVSEKMKNSLFKLTETFRKVDLVTSWWSWGTIFCL